MMKRIVLLLVVSALLLLTACSIYGNINQTKDHSSNINDTTDLGYLSEVPSENEITVEATDDTAEKTVEADHSGMEENATGAKQEKIDSELLPGPDVAELVNLRGDEVTVYKLADGTYMDRIEKHFTFNGTDTWTDEDGVEWNEKVQ